MRGETARKVQSGERDPEFGPWLAQASILVVDDEPGMRNFLVRTLGPRCKRIEEAADAEEASRKLDQHHFDVVILDNIMPGKHGVDWLIEQRAIGLFSDAILMTAYADLETAIQALRAGAVDFVLKPFRSNQILNAVARCLDRMRLQRENFVLRYELRATADHILLRDKLIGGSAAIQQVRETIARVAPLPTTVLLTGESGTGKEVAARSLHALSDRAAKPFVPVNCAAIPPDVIESELFGHVRGAFTGAEAGREGLFLHAQGGTLFLDEIGEMPLATQSKLLRVIEDRRVRPVGAEREVPVDLRFVFATNADLERLVQEGAFRADLYYRINVMQLKLPPLRDRGDDVLELANLFMHKLSQQLGMPPVAIDRSVQAALARYGWPGNVRELRNLIERSLILGGFPDDLRGQRSGPGPSSSGTLEEVERRHILATLEETKGDREEAARRLGISRKTIDRKLSVWNG
ncbi:MAG: sigma-54-dependent transcriptional regulator [Allorhizobium sp.]